MTREECIRKTNSDFDSKWGISGILGYSYSQKVETILKDEAAAQENALREKLQESMGILPDGFTNVSVRKVEQIGKPSQTITEYRPFTTKSISWAKREDSEPYVQNVCKQIATKVGGDEFLTKPCVESFYAKIKLAEDFVEKNKSAIQSMSESMHRNPSSAVKAFEQYASTRIENLPGRELSLVWLLELVDEGESVGFLKKYTEEGVTDANGAPLGRFMPIEDNGRTERYFVPQNLSSRGIMTYFNPYYFSHGGMSAAQWNSYWEQKLGKQFHYNGKPLNSA